MKQKFLFLALFCISQLTLKAQPEAASSLVQIMERTASTPNTATLGRYFDIPVNMSTGVPGIQIPLYTIKTGNITLPISLSYHGSGIKVNDPASWVGLGWVLNCGGIITKQINGLDDFYSDVQYYIPPEGISHGSHSNYLNPNYTMDTSYPAYTSMHAVLDTMSTTWAATGMNMNYIWKVFGRIIQNWYDGESDEYHYSTPEGSGSIFYNQKKTQFQLNELNGWKVSYGSDSWMLTSKTGMQYYFADRETTVSPSYPMTSLDGSPSYTSAWYLTSIGDVINNRGISFTYDLSGHKVYDQGLSRMEKWTANGAPHSFASGISTNLFRQGKELNINRITFPEGRIDFIKDTAGRADGGVNALKYIKIYDNNGVLKKQYTFTYYYAWGGTVNAIRLFLKSVQEVNYINGSYNETKPYFVEYDTTIAMPGRFTYAQDIWGYNNGRTSNTTIIPTDSILLLQGYPAFADRSVRDSFTQAGIIKKIIYPTGGSISFTFENNRDENNAFVGGLRIKRIVNADSVAGSSITTEYNYNDDNGFSTGKLQYRPSFHYYVDAGQANITYLKVSGEPIYPLFSNQGSPVAYGRVEKIELGNGDEHKSRHFFYDGLEWSDVGVDLNLSNMEGVPFNKFSNIQRFSNLPRQTQYFKKENGEFKLIQRDSSSYTSLNRFNEYVYNVQAAWKQSLGGFCEWADWDPYTRIPLLPAPSINAYKLFQESVTNNFQSSKTFDDNGGVIEQAIYKRFDSSNGNLKISTTVASNGDTLRTYYQYATDFLVTSSSDPINDEINTLIDANISGPVEIIKTRFAPGSPEMLMNAELYLYDNKRLKKILKVTTPVLLSSFVPAYNNNTAFYYDSHYQVENEIVSFQSDNNPSQIDLKSKRQSLLWDGDDMIASVVNAGVTDIAATSFETSEKGRWTYSGTAIADATAPTGKKVYDLDTGNIVRSSLDNGKQYVVSYWSKSGAQTVNSSSPVAGITINGWTFYKHTLFPASGQITVSGTATIDELRLYPESAVMTTYTYEPLVGMKTQCDINNRISYYSYDGFGRLLSIRDQDRNILKKFCYNYTGQPENCATECVNTSADWQNTATAPVCEQGVCGNTGYQLQEQRDMNPCSATYNQLQTDTIYNPAACVPASGITITYSNTSGVSGFTAVYTPKAGGGPTYTFNIPSSASGTLGCIPSGVYTLVISKTPSGLPPLLLFGNGCQYVSGSWSATLSGTVLLGCGINLSIEWDL